MRACVRACVSACVCVCMYTDRILRFINTSIIILPVPFLPDDLIISLQVD